MADLAPMDQDEDMADGPPDDGVDILEEAAPDEDEAKPTKPNAVRVTTRCAQTGSTFSTMSSGMQ